jgi:hypothetical protein
MGLSTLMDRAGGTERLLCSGLYILVNSWAVYVGEGRLRGAGPGLCLVCLGRGSFGGLEAAGGGGGPWLPCTLGQDLVLLDGHPLTQNPRGTWNS